MSDTAIYLIICGVLASALAFAIYKIIKAFKTGRITMSGNRPIIGINTYSRKDVPLGFWGGIVSYGFLGFICLISLIMMLFIVFSTEV